MNQNAKRFLKNIIGAVGANVVRLMISVLLTLLLPKLMGQEEYSYWQLYLFYGTYLAYSSLGWCEGFTLKYGGYHYEELNKPLIIGQIWMLFLKISSVTSSTTSSSSKVIEYSVEVL